jgi:hypothetical protein
MTERILGPEGSQRRRRFLWAPMLAVVAFVVIFTISASANPPLSTCTTLNTVNGSNFEIDVDANIAVDGGTGCVDWQSADVLANGLFKADKPTGSGDDSFGNGTAEDNPNPTITDGSIPPNKSDLKQFGLYQEAGAVTADNPSGKYLALYWARINNPSGTTNMDFELNQNKCDAAAADPTLTCANNGTKTPVYVTPKRKTGDRLVTYDLSKGGTVPSISIRTWSGSAWGPATVISGPGGEAVGSVNTSTIGQATPLLTAQSPFTFGEASLAFSALFGTNTCGSFGSVYLKSRSSDSFTSEIKDFVAPQGVSISNCATLTTTATTSVTLTNSISDTAHLGGVSTNAAGIGTITFRVYSNSDCSTQVGSDLGTTTTVIGPGDYVSQPYTPTALGTYYWRAFYSGDGSNASQSTACGDANESSDVVKAPSSISTGQFFYPQDTATVTGGTSGTVTFTLYPTANCTGTALFGPSGVTLSSGTATTNNTTAKIDATSAGTYSWKASYGGDAGHNSVESCTENTTYTITNGGTTTGS